MHLTPTHTKELVFSGFVIAVMDRAHLKLKMEYKQKKKIQRKLEFAMEKNKYYKVKKFYIVFIGREVLQHARVSWWENL